MTLFILKLTLCWGFFALLYALLLRHETFFRLNRLYLLSTAAMGIALAGAGHLLPPDLLGNESMATAVLPVVSIGLQQVDAVAQQWDFAGGLWAVYWLGFFITAARTGWGIARLVGMAVRGKSQRLPDGCLLIETEESAVPFSFFKWIFVPTSNFELQTSNLKLQTLNLKLQTP